MENNPQAIWQSQPTEPSTMTVQQIQRKTQELRAKTRRALLGAMITPLLVAVVAGWIVAQLPSSPLLRMAFVFAVAWSLAGPYFVSRGMFPAMPSATPGLESYRREVERRRALLSRFLLWTFGPVVFALGTFIVPLLSGGWLRNMIPFLALVIIWIVSVFVIRMRDQRELRREIDELDRLERPGN